MLQTVSAPSYARSYATSYATSFAALQAMDPSTPVAHMARPALADQSAPSLPPASIAVGWADMTPHRDFLVRFAQRRLLDPALAEDLVHDVFEAVVCGRALFGGRSSLRSWLAAILKHKIVDLVRQRSGHDSLDASDGDDQPWMLLECPQPRPDEVAEQRQLLRQTLARIRALPPGLRQVLEMRVLHERSTEDVCESLAISEDNLFVRLHRARKRLAS